MTVRTKITKRIKVNKMYERVPKKFRKKIHGRTCEEMNQIQQPPWLIKNIQFCYEEETQTENDSERKQHFLQN